MIAQVFATLLPIFLVAGIGSLYGYFRTAAINTLNRLNMELFVPLLVFAALANQQAVLGEYIGLAIAAGGVVLGSGLLLWPVAYFLNLDRRTFLPPMMFNNTGNMGIPLIVFAFGEEALPAAVIVFIVEMLLHFSVGLYLVNPLTSLRQLLRIPIVIASLAGLAVNLVDVPLPEWLLEGTHMLGEISIPLMLFALGVRMLDIDFSGWKLGLLGAILCPLSGLLMAIPFVLWFNLSGLQASTLWVFAALPPAVLNYLVAEQYRQEPHKVASLVLIGNLGSLVVMPLVLGFVFAYGEI
ncbi:AEC family transporter [Pistricoccus aurantiacus]|uniref:AEC family transporter n=1 Tax=Pistricoccus aurantiacus TaxID=1883414 RepID=UPI00362F2FC1